MTGSFQNGSEMGVNTPLPLPPFPLSLCITKHYMDNKSCGTSLETDQSQEREFPDRVE